MPDCTGPTTASLKLLGVPEATLSLLGPEATLTIVVSLGDLCVGVQGGTVSAIYILDETGAILLFEDGSPIEDE